MFTLDRANARATGEVKRRLRPRGRYSSAQAGLREAVIQVRELEQRSQGRNNQAMTIFYWVMGVLIVGTFVPSALFLLLYAMTGNDVLARRARGFWDVTRVLALLGSNILIWGHVIVGLWRIWFS
jgi:hypothetical protein